MRFSVGSGGVLSTSVLSGGIFRGSQLCGAFVWRFSTLGGLCFGEMSSGTCSLLSWDDVTMFCLFTGSRFSSNSWKTGVSC